MKFFFNPRLLEKLFNAIAFVLLLAMMSIVAGSVLARYFFQSNVHGVIELTEFIMVAIVFFTFAYTQAQKGHIRVELISSMISQRTSLVLDLISILFALVFFSLMAWQGILSTLDAWKYHEVTDGIMEFPTYPAKLTIAVGCLLLIWRYLVDGLEILKSLAAGPRNDS